MLPRRIIISCLALTGVTVVAQKPNAVTGVPVDPNAKSVPLRKNINDLEAAGGAQWYFTWSILLLDYDIDSVLQGPLHTGLSGHAGRRRLKPSVLFPNSRYIATWLLSKTLC